MLSICNGKGLNPYVVNVITFSGHGITYKDDAIAVITEHQKGKDGEVKKVFRFINISYWARKFAAANKALTIFLLSMCRVFIDKVSEDKIVAEKDLSQESL
jgi:ribosomal protein L24